MRSVLIRAALAWFLVTIPGAGAFAAESKVDPQAIKNAKLSVVEAVQIAEKSAGGKATAASLSEAKGNPVYEVDLALADGTTKSLVVDAVTGKLIETTADTENGEGGEHRNDVD